MRVYRKLLPTDLPEFRAHLLRLSPDDRQSRFWASVTDRAIADYCTRIDWLHTIVIGCFDDGALRGAAELRFEEMRLASRAEIAITVEGTVQGQGIGTDLLGQLIVIARNRGLKSLIMLCLLDNRRMQRIARHYEGELKIEEGQVEAGIAMPFPTQLSLMQEALFDGAGLAATWWDTLRQQALRPVS
jgi:GNAT superfamily N-acetyltransferase